ncbi:lipoprotein insertase outer membrane protein LolB [Paraferrimonas sedimenticola]|uniref:Outer-membrane lipoprotein LolB n=1 Tax=Paraferrimonas sedimenticola TaxID=375674 RepID=A0AA37VU40_9GAMM|nr:lipoprotein insertase outer membrane protein LolB [Paraferrimonas sedimenticola]GLP95456.1 outer-membrane lipoprotein LolB [Paraferrimonas sedimenticola]
MLPVYSLNLASPLIQFSLARLTTVLISLFLLGACASAPKVYQVDDAAKVPDWQLNGRIAVFTPKDKFSANLFWNHRPPNQQLKLTTALGITVMSLDADKNGARLKVDGKEYRDKDPQALIAQVTQLPLPLSALSQWVKGETVDGDIVLAIDEQNRPKIVQRRFDNGQLWQAEYQSWQTLSGATVPRMIRIQHKDVRIKLQINQWLALSPPSN